MKESSIPPTLYDLDVAATRNDGICKSVCVAVLDKDFTLHELGKWIFDCTLYTGVDVQNGKDIFLHLSSLHDMVHSMEYSIQPGVYTHEMQHARRTMVAVRCIVDNLVSYIHATTMHIGSPFKVSSRPLTLADAVKYAHRGKDVAMAISYSTGYTEGLYQQACNLRTAVLLCSAAKF
jgi:hypothetical protein